MTMTMKVTKKELVSMIAEAEQIFIGEDSKEKFQPYSEKVIEKVFSFNLMRIQEIFKEVDLPTIYLTSNPFFKGMASYEVKSKKIKVSRLNYQKCLLVEIYQDRPTERVLDIINARMLFSIMHELGHYFDFQNSTHKTIEDVLNELLKITGDTSVEGLKNNVEAEKLILNEAYDLIEKELTADTFAFSNIANHFDSDFEVLNEINEKERRESSYPNYAKRRIRDIVIKLPTSISRTERKHLIKHYEQSLEIN